MSRKRAYQVREVARIAGMSIRALHHYDSIGLLVPKERTGSGYRLYSDDDLLRLQQILIGRELGLSLEDIRRALDDPRFDRRAALQAQRTQLQQRARQTSEMIGAIDAALALIDHCQTGETMDMKQIFSGFDPAKYEEEAKQRWGNTETYRESKRRTDRYGPKEWQQIQAEQAQIYADAAGALDAGKDATDPEVMAIADRHRLFIDRWFYACTESMHRGLTQLYESDARFAENIDKHGAGLTTYLVAALRANAGRQDQIVETV
jgi:DNA-binding transcriptional MerR regulator